MNGQIYKYCIEDDVGPMHDVKYEDVDYFLKKNTDILETLIDCGSWRAYNYLLSLFYITLKERSDMYSCLINILKLEDIEDASSYIALLFHYKMITEKEFHHYLYLYLDQEKVYPLNQYSLLELLD